MKFTNRLARQVVRAVSGEPQGIGNLTAQLQIFAHRIGHELQTVCLLYDGRVTVKFVMAIHGTNTSQPLQPNAGIVESLTAEGNPEDNSVAEGGSA